MTREAVRTKVALVKTVKPAQPEEAPAPLDLLNRFMVTDDQVAQMKATRLIWRDIIALSHLSVWSAPGNGGKTTMAKFAAGELAQSFTVLFFQEDASAGDLPALHEHAKQHGYQLLNTTLSGASSEDQIDVLKDLARSGVALDGFVMFFDTLKKYADLMSKGGSREFFKLMRSLTQRGATIVLLGHTNKHRGVDGKLMFEGVGDVRNDVDEMIYIEATEKDANGVVTLTLRPDKVRCAVKESTYALDTRSMQIRPLDQVIDVGALVESQRERRADASLIEVFVDALQAAGGGMKHTELIERVIKVSQAPRRRVLEVFGRYCAEDVGGPDAIWIETRMRVNNVRYVSLNPVRAQ